MRASKFSKCRIPPSLGTSCVVSWVAYPLRGMVPGYLSVTFVPPWGLSVHPPFVVSQEPVDKQWRRQSVIRRLQHGVRCPTLSWVIMLRGNAVVYCFELPKQFWWTPM